MTAVLHRQPVQLHSHGAAAPIEAKVAVPAVVGSGVVGVAGAVLYLLQAFGVELSEVQVGAILGLVAALLPGLQFVVGYYTRHTPRPDVDETTST